ncbi:hypothetical protein AERO9AM_30612 [Aeromicrobium sp. 9AM]|nr:hypothetical protein AERO9AM_30612 [Aeromicrobium sp. 9AM]
MQGTPRRSRTAAPCGRRGGRRGPHGCAGTIDADLNGGTRSTHQGGVVSCHPSGPRNSTPAHTSESTTGCQKIAKLPTFPTQLFVSTSKLFASAPEPNPTATSATHRCADSAQPRSSANSWTPTLRSHSCSRAARAMRSEITCNTSDPRTKSANSEAPEQRPGRSDHTPAGTSRDDASTPNANTARRSEVHSKPIANPIASAIANALAKRCLCDSNVSVIANVSVRGSLPKSVYCIYHLPLHRHLGDRASLATAGAGKG